MIMRETEDTNGFKEALLQLFETNEHEEIRETCEAIRQMYQVDLIDVVADILEKDSEPYKAACKWHLFMSPIFRKSR